MGEAKGPFLLSLPFAEHLQRSLQGRALGWVRGLSEQTFIGRDREIECRWIIIRAGEAGSVVRQRRTCQLILRELSRYFEPAINARAEIRLGERPQMPGAAIAHVCLPCATGERADDLGSTTCEPGRVREHHHRLCVLRTRRDGMLVRWYDDLWHVVVRPRGVC